MRGTDAWEVRTCEGCGWPRRVLVRRGRRLDPRTGEHVPTEDWRRRCGLCDARDRVQDRKRDLDRARVHLAEEEAKRARESRRRDRRPLDRTPRPVTQHAADPDYLGFPLCGTAGYRARVVSSGGQDVDEVNCKPCRRALAALEAEEGTA